MEHNHSRSLESEPSKDIARRPLSIGLFDVDNTLLTDTPDEMTGRAFWSFVDSGELQVEDDTLDHLSSLRDKHGSAESDKDRRLYLTPLNKTFDALVTGKSRKLIDKLTKNVIAQLISDDELFPEMIEVIQTLKDDGHYVGLLSRSPGFLVNELGKEIGTDFNIGLHFAHVKDTYDRYRSTKPQPEGAEKKIVSKSDIADGVLASLSLRRLRALGYTPSSATSRLSRPPLAYFPSEHQFSIRTGAGNALDDLEIIERATKQNIVVNGEPDLVIHAQDNNWTCLNLNKTVKQKEIAA